MILLVLSPWFPCPPDNGARLRAFHLLREWARAGHTIRLVTGLQDDIADRCDRYTLELVCESVAVFPWRWHDGGSRSALRHLLSPVPRSITDTAIPALREAVAAEFARKPDACVAMELAAAPFVPQNTHGVPVLLEQVEVSGVAKSVRDASGAGAKMRAALTRAKHDRYWRRELGRFDVLTAVSEQEAAAVRTLVGASKPPVMVVPNGVDTAHYSDCALDPVPGRFLYNGSLTYGPNRAAVTWFVSDILPLIAARHPDAHLVATGRVTEEIAAQFAGNERVRLTGFVPDMRPVLDTASLCVVPLATGGGTRLKILEAWAAGVPVVATTVGAAGLAGSEDGVHLLLADTTEKFAEHCERLLSEPQERRRIAENARRLVEKRYEWRDLATQITGLLEAVRAVDSSVGDSR